MESNLIEFVKFVSLYSIEAKEIALKMIKNYRISRDIESWNSGIAILDQLGLDSSELNKFEIKEENYEGSQSEFCN